MHRNRLHTALLTAIVSGSLAVAGSMAIAQTGQQTGQAKQQHDPATQDATQQRRAGQDATRRQATEQMGARQPDQMRQAGQLGPKDRMFIETALSSSAAEVELGRLAEQKASNNEVRQFARQMQQHHQQAKQELAAMSPQVTAEMAEPAGKHRRKIEQLGQLEGERFDAAYTELVVELHREDVELFQAIAQSEEFSPQVRNFASQTVNELRQHLQMAQQLDQQVGAVAGIDD